MFEEYVDLSVCNEGMHFCEKASDCFNYYKFDSKNKVAVVIAHGEVRTDGVKSCTNKLEIACEILAGTFSNRKRRKGLYRTLQQQ